MKKRVGIVIALLALAGAAIAANIGGSAVQESVTKSSCCPGH